MSIKTFAKFFDHFEGNVLAAFFDAVDGGLAGANFFAKVSLSKIFHNTSARDYAADLGFVVRFISHIYNIS